LYGLPERWKQKKKAPGFVAPALLLVIDLVERRRPRLRIALTSYAPAAILIFYFLRM
jgi:hypothetical protein